MWYKQSQFIIHTKGSSFPCFDFILTGGQRISCARTNTETNCRIYCVYSRRACSLLQLILCVENLSVIFQWNSLVDIVTRLESGRWTNHGSFPGWSKVLFTNFGPHAYSCIHWVQEHLLHGQNHLEVTLFVHVPVVLGLRKYFSDIGSVETFGNVL
jgi:hypothetical protein